MCIFSFVRICFFCINEFFEKLELHFRNFLFKVTESAQVPAGDVILRQQANAGRQLDRTVEARDRRPREDPPEA